jgi:hypothetical protein
MTEVVQTVKHPRKSQPTEVELPIRLHEPEKLGAVDSPQRTTSDVKGLFKSPGRFTPLHDFKSESPQHSTRKSVRLSLIGSALHQHNLFN